MKIRVKVKPCSSVARVIKNQDGSLKINLKSSPVNGKANKELCAVLADYYKVSKSQIEIKIGKTSKTKIININR